MRCPKCGFISFDHLENCKKCDKPLGEVLVELKGTIFDAEPPQFLSIDWAASKPVVAQSPMAQEVETVTEEAFALEEDAEGGVSFEMEPEPERREIEMPGMDDEVVMTLDDPDEVSPEGEFTLDLGDQMKEGQTPMPALDFGDLDISDLAPPEKEVPPIVFEEKLVLSDTEPVAALSPLPPKPAPAVKLPTTGLEDLNFDGLDLDTPAKLMPGVLAGKTGVLPSVKTGTALDNFDIDLGELFSENKK